MPACFDLGYTAAATASCFLCCRNLVPKAVAAGTAQPGWVEVQVKAVGINFRDVLNVLGMYPGDPGAPGGDFAGIVARVPAGAATSGGLQPGDAVFGLAAGSLGSYVHASSHTIVPMPASIRWVFSCCTQTTCLPIRLAGRAGTC
jgi:NADPH:quinone reductase-like Zn-dependent oxidoreductase